MSGPGGGPGGGSGGSGFGFGFGGSGGSGGSGDDPGGLAGKIPLFAELERLLSHQDGPVNWDLARQVAIRTAAEGDPAADSRGVADAVRLADLWLDPATAMPSGLHGEAQAWTRVRWVEATLTVWRTLCDPVAAKVAEAMGSTLQSGLAQLQGGDQPALPPELAAALPADLGAALAPMMGIMGQVGGLMFGAQIGQAVGELSKEVLSSTEVGLPLGEPGVAALVPANIVAFGEGLSVPAEEIRLYLALREAAHHRLFGHVPWLRGRLLAAVEAYAQGISVDPEAVQRAIGGVDPTNPESLQQALGGDLFATTTSPDQEQALARLETLLALVEGWVDEVVGAAAGALPSAAALRETIRRRRASGGPAEQTFSALVGLTLRPRRLREAADLWSQLRDARGVAGRDSVWEHPDLLPASSDLDDPQAYLAGFTGASPDPGMPDAGPVPETSPETPPEGGPSGP